MLNEINKTHKDAAKQFGFKQNSSCQNAIFTVRETIIHQTGKGKPVYACAIEASKAFDKVNRTALFYKLKNRIKPQIWKLLKNYYDNSTAFVHLNGQQSNMFQTTIGVKQGGPLSPKLFSIYIEDIITELEKEELILNIEQIRTGIVLFADDIIILCKSKECLNRSLQICDEYGTAFEIKYNPDKTKYMIFSTKKQCKENPNIKLSGKSLEKVTNI
jgi:RNA-directed DNA polymerase